MQRFLLLIGAGMPRGHGASRAFAHPAATDHRAVFHAFAAGLARVLKPHRPTARVRAVEG